MATAEPKIADEEQFDWVQFKRDFSTDHTESRKAKLIRKIKENPLVPIGCIATTLALGFGLWNFRKGDSRKSQLMMRARIGAQGFTVFALIVGVMTMYMNKPSIENGK